MLKKAQVNNIVDEAGNESSFELKIKDVIFKYEEASAEIIFRKVPNNFVKGVHKDQFLSVEFQFDLKDAETVNLVGSISLKLWTEVIPNLPLVVTEETIDDELTLIRKSLNDIGASIVDA